MRTWQLQDAKARLSELVKRASLEGPQGITLRGEPAVVVLSSEDYARLTRRKPGFVRLMRESPLAGVDLDAPRDRTRTRDPELR